MGWRWSHTSSATAGRKHKDSEARSRRLQGSAGELCAAASGSTTEKKENGMKEKSNSAH